AAAPLGLAVRSRHASRPRVPRLPRGKTRTQRPPREAVPQAAAPKIGAKLESILLSFLDGLGSLGSLRDVLVVAAASLFLWTLIGFQIWSTMRAFDLVFPFPVSFF